MFKSHNYNETFVTTLIEAYYAAHLAGMSPTMLPLVPELDGWIYETTRDGEMAERMGHGGPPILRKSTASISYRSREARFTSVSPPNI